MFYYYLSSDAGKYLHPVGPGGCRGEEWASDDGDWPKWKGRQTFDACALACAKDDDCSAIHVLREDEEEKTFECLLFDHDDVIAVGALGGGCFELEDEPQGVEEKEADVEIGKGHDRKRMAFFSTSSFLFSRWSYRDCPSGSRHVPRSKLDL